MKFLNSDSRFSISALRDRFSAAANLLFPSRPAPARIPARSDQTPDAAPFTFHASRLTPHASPTNFNVPAFSVSAFSLIEILVTVGLLSFIILGLLAVFNQTQRAFTSSMTQTDVLEGGRATMGMLAGEVEMASASRSPDFYPNGSAIPYRATNFFVEPSPGFPTPFLQELPGNAAPRTNIVQRLFFLNKINQDWVGIGYQVLPDDANGYLGTLYRFCSTNSRFGALTLAGDFQYAASVAYQNARAGLPVTNITWFVGNQRRIFAVSRIDDGIMDFRVRAFATNGFIIRAKALQVAAPILMVTNGYCITPLGPYTNVANTIIDNSFDPVGLQSHCYFMNNAVPAYVELELGFLEAGTLRRYRGIPIPAAQGQYLSNHVAQLHLFRQRVSVRNVDFSAYPPYQ